METVRYVPLKEEDMKTYIFQAEVEQEEDGRWSAWIEALPGCAVWGYSKEEAIEALQDAAQAYIEVLIQKGQSIPLARGVEALDTPAVAVNV
jgi:predicted RNase H-like HicB family nuclease